MKTIWKYPIHILDQAIKIEMPEKASVIYVDIQNELPHIWVEVNPHATKEIRRFATFGTGHGITEKSIYLGSYQKFNGVFVGHIYELF